MVGANLNRRVQARLEGDGRLFCTNCGHPNNDDARFCAKCGSPLQDDSTLSLAPVELDEETTDDFPFPHDELQPGQGLLLVKRGPNAGSTFLLEQELTTAGRSTDSDVFLDDITVSRKHAEFTRKAGAFFVRDVGSLNGTYVNGEQVEETKLASHDEVQIGKFKLVFFAAGES
jgi:pSer/pThr/pTyr-binding forkhead associated (FHA) protein